MGRIQVMEFEDLDWFPSLWRKGLTDTLYFYNRFFNLYGAIVPKLREVLEKLECRYLVDLGSGSAGPMPMIVEQLQKRENYEVEAILTDKYPDLEGLEKAGAGSKGRINFRKEPIDAANVPPDLNGFRTMFTSFHHFDPVMAGKILQDAAKKNAGIGIFEINSRKVVPFVSMMAAPLFVLIFTLLVRPWSLARLFWTYIIPAVPLAALWDAIASNLRYYSPPELQSLVEGISEDGYVWEIGTVPSLLWFRVTYLFGYPLPDGD